MLFTEHTAALHFYQKLKKIFKKSVDTEILEWYNSKAVTRDGKQKDLEKWTTFERKELNPCIHLSKFQKK